MSEPYAELLRATIPGAAMGYHAEGFVNEQRSVQLTRVSL